ncbi:MAG: hypothetical protein ABFS86_08285 [Planctomycetota bacterium]
MTALIAGLLLVAGFLPACRSTYNASPADADEVASEGSMVFVRPGRYSVIGTRNIRAHIEVIYEKTKKNEVGMPVVEFGLRNKGSTVWWDVKAGDLALSAKVEFYETPLDQTGPTGPPRFDSGWQTIPIRVGETSHHSVTSPVKDAPYYRVTISKVK